MTILTNPNTPLSPPEAIILGHLHLRPFQRQHELAAAASLPGDYHNWLTYATLRSLQSRGLVQPELIPGPSSTRRPIKVWRPTKSPKVVVLKPAMRKRDVPKGWFRQLRLF